MNEIPMQELLDRSATRHNHLCPRQVLGVRIGLAGADRLGLALPRSDKRLLVILETDGCFADGIEVATGCTIGHRTLRLEDYGKIAATFVDTELGIAVRVAPGPDIRQRSYNHCPDEKRHYFAQLKAYQVMPVEELLAFQPVSLCFPIDKIVSRAGLRVNCCLCGEEIINERQVVQAGRIYCRACAGGAYYQAAQSVQISPILTSISLQFMAEV